MKLKYFMLAAMFFVVVASAAHGQSGTVSSGCDSSPENPTAILALVGAGSGFVMALRSRLRRK